MDEQSIGTWLVTNGWSTGATFSAPVDLAYNAVSAEGNQVEVKSKKVKESERLVVASHICDIASANEPFVEVMVCIKEKSRLVEEWDRNSARRFIVDPDGPWVAKAYNRILIAKEMLRTLAIQPVPMESERAVRFANWLARRSQRYAIPDEFHPRFVRPVDNLLRQLESTEPEIARTFNHSVRETRFVKPPDWNNPSPIIFYYLHEGAGLSEELSTAIDRVHGEIVRICQEQRVPIDPNPEIIPLDEIAHGDYLKTVPLNLDYLSEGDDEAALPSWRIAAETVRD